MFTIQEWFGIGMKRDIAQLIEPGPIAYDIGTSAGANVTPGCLTLPEDWRAPELPMEDKSVDTIFANHFMEHLDGATAIDMLREFERVLKVGGSANIVTPYYRSLMAVQDLDHKSFWCEETWPITFNNKYYQAKGSWKLEVNACLIIGIVERNLALFTQLKRVE